METHEEACEPSIIRILRAEKRLPADSQLRIRPETAEELYWKIREDVYNKVPIIPKSRQAVRDAALSTAIAEFEDELKEAFDATFEQELKNANIRVITPRVPAPK